MVKEYVSSLEPKLSGIYHHDETEVKVDGEVRYFWETIDEDTRFIVAHLLTEDRTSEEAAKVFKQALEKQKPIAFFTDGSFATFSKTAICVIQADILALTYMSFTFLLKCAEWLRKAQFQELNGLVLVQ